MLYVVCCVLYVVCCMLYVVCCMWCVVCCGVVCSVVVCGVVWCCVVLCGVVRLGMRKTPSVCRFKKTPPCVRSRRLRVYRGNARMFNTCGRFPGTHGGVLNAHTEAF